MTVNIESLKNWYQTHQEKILEDFFTYLKFPSISTDPQYKDKVLDTAKWLEKYLNNMGLEAEIWKTSGHPVVFASYLKAGPNRPTVLFYHHYDVQPIDPIELWNSHPFEPIVKDNKVYARGAADNKGQCFYSITAIKAFLELAKSANVNIKIFIEGEEESGGVGTYKAIDEMQSKLKADHLLIVDLGIPAPDIPAIQLGLRGIVTMEAVFTNSSIDLHSGSHGGMVLNPNRAMIQILSKLWDKDGRVTIPGFYDEVQEISQKDRSQLATEFNEEAYKKAFGIGAVAPEKGFSLLESNWFRPTLEINGLSGGYAGNGFKTVIPAKAVAKISCRLVPDQDPEKIVKSIETFLRSHLPQGMSLKITQYQGVKAYRSPSHTEIVGICKSAYEDVFGKPCKSELTGGSIPIVPALAKASGAQVSMMGLGLDSDAIHAPNEHFGLDRFKKGFLIIGSILEKLENL